MQIHSDVTTNTLTPPPPQQRCTKIATFLATTIACLGIAACITAAIFSPSLPCLIIIGGALAGLISIVFLCGTILRLRKENLDTLKSMGKDISDHLDKKYEELKKDYMAFISSTQKELNSIQLSISKNKDQIDQHQGSLNRQQKEIDTINNAKKSKKA
ncbi:hypothetical protein O1W69_03140 [Chlamydia sp. 12-01]|uniref:hypothetical protein n=1 Tax=Chlamydia sp. 12-01 TaxID=3002742 RepID=UPI0035D4D851